MSFQWEDYWQVANELSGASSTDKLYEAKIRTVISRAYYASFNIGKQYLIIKHGFRPQKNADDHGDVRKKFFSINSPECNTIAANLDQMRRARNRADYDDQIANVHKLLSGVMRSADATIKLINQLPP